MVTYRNQYDTKMNSKVEKNIEEIKHSEPDLDIMKYNTVFHTGSNEENNSVYADNDIYNNDINIYILQAESLIL